MTLLNKFIKPALITVAAMVIITIVNAQQTKPAKETIIKNLVDSQRYVFNAAYVTPLSGRQRFLTDNYTVMVTKDTVNSDLPYFGRAYSAPINPQDNGIKFTSTYFDYKVINRKKGGWDITIKPKDVTEVQSLNFRIFNNGRALLSVISNNRQGISFDGSVQPVNAKK